MAAPSTVPRTRRDWLRREALDRPQHDPLGARRLDHRATRSDARSASTEAASWSSRAPVVRVVGEVDLGHLGPAARQRSGLVEHDQARTGAGSARGGLHQDAAATRRAGADHDRHRRREPEGARLGTR